MQLDCGAVLGERNFRRPRSVSPGADWYTMIFFDAHTLSSLVLIAVIGGVLGLDRTAAGQFMISQPIVAGPITGWILGDATVGLIIGALLELIWVMDMPVGTFVPADSTAVTVSSTAIAVLGGAGEPVLPVIGFSILLTVGMVPITTVAENRARKWMSRLADMAIAAPGEVVGQRLARAHLSGLVVFFLKSFIVYLVLLPLGLAAIVLFRQMPDTIHRAMELFVKFLPLVGVAAVVRKLSIRTADRFLLAGIVAAAILSMAFHVPAVFITAVTVGLGWIGVRYGER